MQEALAEDQLAEVSACWCRQADRQLPRVCIQVVIQSYDQIDARGAVRCTRAYDGTGRFSPAPGNGLVAAHWHASEKSLGNVPTGVFVFMAARKIPDRFLVAFSLAGEQRDLVRSIADAVEGMLGRQTVFLDEWYEHYLAGADVDLKLQNIYGSRSRLHPSSSWPRGRSLSWKCSCRSTA